MTYIVFDAETTVKNNKNITDNYVGDEWGSAFHPDNKVVLCGWKVEGSKVVTDEDTPILTKEVDLLVGHNIRFDMHYLDKYTCGDFPEWLHNTANAVWDTQIVEYLLTAQQHKFASLDELSEIYGGTQKLDGMKEYWQNGGQTEDIPRERLEEYLIGDVENTERVYLGQREIAEQYGMMPLIKTQMRALVATWEMRRNGMCFNVKKAMGEAARLESKVAMLESSIKDTMVATHEKAEAKDLVPGSASCLSRILYGGSYVYYDDVPVTDELGDVVRYKSGKRKGEIKTKKEERRGFVKGMTTPDPEWETKKAGVYRVGDGELAVLLKKKLPKEAKELIEQVRELRALEKDRTTYFLGYSKLAWPEDGKFFIHGDLNLCQTNTGRLSSSKPNLQNLSNQTRD